MINILICEDATLNKNMRSLFQRYNFAVSLVAGLILFSQSKVNAQQAETDGKNFEPLKANAERGDAAAQDKLGDYFNYISPTRDKSAAFVWYRKAAEQGNVPLQTE